MNRFPCRISGSQFLFFGNRLTFKVSINSVGWRGGSWRQTFPSPIWAVTLPPSNTTLQRQKKLAEKQQKSWFGGGGGDWWRGRGVLQIMLAVEIQVFFVSSHPRFLWFPHLLLRRRAENFWKTLQFESSYNVILTLQTAFPAMKFDNVLHTG